MITDEGKKYELGVVLDNRNVLSIRIMSFREIALRGLAIHVNYNLLTLVFSINLRIKEKDMFGVANQLKIKDFAVLSKDKKFMSLLERTKQLFDERYQDFTQLKT